MEESKIVKQIKSFYLDISKELFSDRENRYVLAKLNEKLSKAPKLTQYNNPSAKNTKIYVNLFLKAKKLIKTVTETADRKLKIQNLRKKHLKQQRKATKYKRGDLSLKRQISDSKFPFSLRFRKVLKSLDFFTIKQLTDVRLTEYTCYRGIGPKCIRELIDFIEFENIQSHFHGFHHLKKSWNKGKRNF